MVLHPEVLRASREKANPLDKLTFGETLKIYGEDPDAIAEDAERRMTEWEEKYLQGPLSYRVELVSVTGLGFQGVIGGWAIESTGHSDSDLTTVLGFINSAVDAVPSLSKDETYLSRLVSLDSDGTRYIWNTKRLHFDGTWRISEWT